MRKQGMLFSWSIYSLRKERFESTLSLTCSKYLETDRRT